MSVAAAMDPALRIDEGGSVRVGKTRVTLRSVVFAFNSGASAEEIVLRYPSLDLTDTYAAITYYLRSQESGSRRPRASSARVRPTPGP